jgi:hypothetical protein
MRGFTFTQACDAVVERLQPGDTVAFVPFDPKKRQGVPQPARPGEAFRINWAKVRNAELIELAERVAQAESLVARGEFEKLERLGYADHVDGNYRILHKLIERDRQLSRMTPAAYERQQVRAYIAVRSHTDRH